MSVLTIVGSPKCALHDMDPEHPEHPHRLFKINDQLIASGLETVVRFADAKPATPDCLKLAHDPEFVRSVIAKAPSEGHIWLDDDTLMMEHSLPAALYAAGSGRDAVDLIMRGESDRAFCTVRPPGHHAGYAESGGFCIFNNVAVAARHALVNHGLERVAIIDFDVHHGNGTEDIFKDDERVMFCSSFQHPFYPFSGDKPTKSHVQNIPIPAGTKGMDYREMVLPWFDSLNKFKPQMVFISAGFDAHAEDDLGHLRLVENDYIWLTENIKQVAIEHANGRVVSMLEGGYALSALARSVVAHIKALI